MIKTNQLRIVAILLYVKMKTHAEIELYSINTELNPEISNFAMSYVLSYLVKW